MKQIQNNWKKLKNLTKLQKNFAIYVRMSKFAFETELRGSIFLNRLNKELNGIWLIWSWLAEFK